MRVPLTWLQEFFSKPLSADELAERLTMGGIEVEGIEGQGADAIIVLGVTPNRGDCLSILGVAREVAALCRLPLRVPRIKTLAGRGRMADLVRMRLEAPDVAPRYTARAIRSVKVGSSPAWLRDRLQAAGVRSINNVVDATNYVMLERGQPLHAFDLVKLTGQQLTIGMAHQSQRFRTLDGVDRLLVAQDLLIMDGQGPVALAGVMGGERSEVSLATTDLLLESAFFEPTPVRRTTKRLGLMTESSRRFERGVDRDGVLAALQRLTALIVEVAGGVPSADSIDLQPKRRQPVCLSLQLAELERILSLSISTKLAARHLKAVGCRIERQTKKGITVLVPSYRSDLFRPIDLIEEIARLEGYEAIPERIPVRRNCGLSRPSSWAFKEKLTTALRAAGFSEAMIMSFGDAKKEALLASVESPPISLANPLSTDSGVMRQSLVAGLLDAYALNRNRQQTDVRLFALQHVFHGRAGGHREPSAVSGIMAGERFPEAWEGGRAAVDFYDLKGIVETMLEAVGLLADASFAPADLPFLHPALSAVLLIGETRVGFLGRLHPSTAATWDIKEEPYIFEFNLDLMTTPAKRSACQFRELQRYPFVERDISLLIDKGVSADAIMKAITEAGGDLVRGVHIFDSYSGKGIAPEKKSMAFSIRFSSPDRTLTDEEVTEHFERIVAALSKAFNALLRS